jgi:methionyl-tRNA formyltransferase
MQMDTGLDTGPMLLRRSIQIAAEDTGGSLHDRLATEGANALLEALDRLANGSAMPVAQPESGVTYAAKLDKAEARIDWTARAIEIERRVRAFNPWPIAETLYEGEQLRVLKARAEPEDSTRPGGQPPGTILSTSERGVLVQCGTGLLAIAEVQRPGKRPVSARDFANQAPLVGRRLG